MATIHIEDEAQPCDREEQGKEEEEEEEEEDGYDEANITSSFTAKHRKDSVMPVSECR